MSVDLVVNRFADIQSNIGAGALAWCKSDNILAIQTELGGDWIPYLQAGAFYTAVPLAPSSLAHNASADVAITLPPGKFTQSPQVLALVSSTTRYVLAVKSVTKDQVVVRVSNFSGVASTDVAPYIRLTVLQTFV
jgi:hypothetical protein